MQHTKNNRKRILAVLLSLFMLLSVLPITALADDVPYASGTFDGCGTSWKLMQDGTLILSGNGEIPNSYDYYRPWDQYRWSEPYLHSIVIEEGVTRIGSEAFWDCWNISGDLVIPTTLESVGYGAFYGCQFTSVRCSTLEQWCNIDFGGWAANPLTYSSTGNLYIGGELFTTFAIPADRTDIKQFTFAGCRSLTGQVVIPDNLEGIGYEAFDECCNVTSVVCDTLDHWCNIDFADIHATPLYYAHDLYLDGALYTTFAIPADRTYIKPYTFAGCQSLQGEVVIPDNLEGIGWDAFYECYNLTSVTCNTLEHWCNIDFSSHQATPLYHAGQLYLNGELYTSFVLPAERTDIKQFTFCGCKSLIGDLVIPDRVTSIGQGAFYNCTELNGTLTLGGSGTQLSYIGDESFYNCYGLHDELVIPNTVTYIGNSAFYDCYGFEKTLTIGNQVETIGSSAFADCYNLKGNLVIPDSVRYIYYGAFSNCYGFEGTLTLGNQVEFIEGSAFYNCHGLKGNIVIPDTVRYIGWQAFDNCYGFDGTLTLGSDQTQLYEISGYAFRGCSNLKGNLVIPDSVQNIREWAFADCTGFNGTLNLGGEDSQLSNIYEGAFINCTGLKGDLVIPNRVNYIGYDAFSGCTGFDGALRLGNSVTDIRSNAFYDCTGLTKIYADTLEHWCQIYFENPYANPAYVTQNLYFGDELFRNFRLPENLDGIRQYVFYGYEKLTGENPVIPETVGWIGTGAFADDVNLTGNLVIPSSVTSVSDSAFRGCTGLDGYLTLSENLTWIGYSAFEGCTNLKADPVNGLVIPNGVDRLPSCVFQNCSSLNGPLTLPANLTSIESNAFCNSGITGSLVFPESVTYIGYESFANCTGLDGTLTFGNNLATIGYAAFRNCANLTGTLYIPDREPVFDTEGKQIVFPVNIEGDAFHGCAINTDPAAFFENYKNSDRPYITIYERAEYQAPTSLADGYRKDAVYCADCGNFLGYITEVLVYKGVTDIEFQPSDINMTIADTFTPTVIYTPSDATSTDLNYDIEDPGIVEVDENGVLRAIGIGSTTITVTTVDESSYASTTITVTVSPRDISDAVIQIDPQYYNGSEIVPSMNVTINDMPLYQGSDYQIVSFENNVGPGTATVTIEGINDYYGTLSASFTITKNIREAEVLVEGQLYDGSEKTPPVTVIWHGEELRENVDFEIDHYKDNVQSGNAMVVINGINDFSGTTEGYFRIAYYDLSGATVTVDENQFYTGYEICPAVSVELNGTPLYEGSDYWVEYRDNVEPGTATVIIHGDKDYYGTVTATFEIRKNMEEADVYVDTVTYTGEPLTPPVTVMWRGQELVQGQDYEVSYENNTEVGTARVIITGINDFSGERTGEFEIRKDFESKKIFTPAGFLEWIKRIIKSIVEFFEGIVGSK